MSLKNLFVSFLFIAVAGSLACRDIAAPDNAKYSAIDAAALRNIVVSGPGDVPLDEGEVLPPEFHEAPLIGVTFIDIGFLPGMAWVTASMRYTATHARLALHLKVKKGDVLVASDSSVVIDENLLPMPRYLSTRVNISTLADCGYRADAKASFTVWMAFPIPKTGNLFTWGHRTDTGFKLASQDPCPSVHVAGGGTPGGWIDDLLNGDFPEGSENDLPDDVYDGNCQLCQLWYATGEDGIVSFWWECSSVDDYFCDDQQNTVR